MIRQIENWRAETQCQNCGDMFKPLRPGQKYCNNKTVNGLKICRKKTENDRKNERKRIFKEPTPAGTTEFDTKNIWQNRNILAEMQAKNTKTTIDELEKKGYNSRFCSFIEDDNLTVFCYDKGLRFLELENGKKVYEIITQHIRT